MLCCGQNLGPKLSSRVMLCDLSPLDVEPLSCPTISSFTAGEKSPLLESSSFILDIIA